MMQVLRCEDCGQSVQSLATHVRELHRPVVEYLERYGLPGWGSLRIPQQRQGDTIR